MALLSDGLMASIEDMHRVDTQLLDVAKSEGIDVTAKLELAQQEIAQSLQTLLDLQGTKAGVDHVVVTPPLVWWHRERALTMVYRDAFQSQLNDRYLNKLRHYERLERASLDQVIARGIGMAYEPIPRASAPSIAPAGGALPGGAYYVSVAWTNRHGEEGLPSLFTRTDVASGTFEVTPVDPPANATGYVVYAGRTPNTMTRQTPEPLAVTTHWKQPDTLAAGKRIGIGQTPSYTVPAARLLRRG